MINSLTVLRNVNLDKVIMANFDVDAEALDEEISFTYYGF